MSFLKIGRDKFVCDVRQRVLFSFGIIVIVVTLFFAPFPQNVDRANLLGSEPETLYQFNFPIAKADIPYAAFYPSFYPAFYPAFYPSVYSAFYPSVYALFYPVFYGAFYPSVYPLFF